MLWLETDIHTDCEILQALCNCGASSPGWLLVRRAISKSNAETTVQQFSVERFTARNKSGKLGKPVDGEYKAGVLSASLGGRNRTEHYLYVIEIPAINVCQLAFTANSNEPS